MADGGEAGGRRPPLGLLTALWIAGVLAVMWRLVNLAFQGWADQFSGRPATLRDQDVSLAFLLLVAVGVGGPLVIAVVAQVTRRPRAAQVYAVLAVALGVASIPLLASALQNPTWPRSPEPRRPPVCQEHSGGDNRCPGG